MIRKNLALYRIGVGANRLSLTTNATALAREIMLEHAKCERVAQPVEHVTFNHGVLGSSPSALTNQINHLADFHLPSISPGPLPGSCLPTAPHRALVACFRPFFGSHLKEKRHGRNRAGSLASADPPDDIPQ